MAGETMLDTAKQAIKLAKEKGAAEVAAAADLQREVSVTWRDGKLEKITEATTRSLNLRLYVDGRYAAVSTSDLRPEALGSFIENAIALTRTLSPDPHRSLPDPALYQGQAKGDLELADPRYGAVTAIERRQKAQALEAAARAVKGSESIISVTTGFSDTSSEVYRVHSNGFEGSRRTTDFSVWAETTVKDADGRRPEDWADASARFYADLPDMALVGREASERAMAGVGAKKMASAVMPVVIDNRMAGSMLKRLEQAMFGSMLQQKKSFLDGKLGQAVGSAKLTVDDDPLMPRGLASKLWDNEGIAAKRRPLFEGGVLKTYLVDTYYGKKLKAAPTTGETSNYAWKLGDRGQAALIADIKQGVLITRFLGGNSNATTGDFSFGIRGFAIRGGKVAEPVAEMNLSGNHLDLWKRLSAVGNDPYPYAASRTPTLVFDGLQIAGT